ncbi:MAG: fluoride efflux transporter CrcB [Candidatus Gastranaerophilales bacterium]|nr:fluoride efflux transporter CrcB [Candidatus Gastranaerophilales bacterium]
MNFLMVFLGGGLGSVLRYFIKVLCDKHIGYFYPWGTFTVNILGSLFLGFCITLLIDKYSSLDTSTKLFLTVGLAGGFTTFSTFCFESVNFIKDGHFQISLLYMLSSTILGLLAVIIGMNIAKTI